MKQKKRIAIVPGSFDPITNGHIFVINEAIKSYDKVYVAVMINSEKKYMFDLEQRTAIAKAALSDTKNVEVISYDGWLWQLATDLCADAIVKGYRNEKDLAYEREMARFNEERAKNTKTVLLKTDEAVAKISSTLVREKIKNHLPINGLLPQKAIDQIKKITLL